MDDGETGRRIAYWRERRGMTQQLFGDRIGRSKSWVEKVEAGTRSRRQALRDRGHLRGSPHRPAGTDRPGTAARHRPVPGQHRGRGDTRRAGAVRGLTADPAAPLMNRQRWTSSGSEWTTCGWRSRRLTTKSSGGRSPACCATASAPMRLCGQPRPPRCSRRHTRSRRRRRESSASSISRGSPATGE